MPGGPPPRSDQPLLRAIGNSGLLGITSRQLASTTGRSVSEVEETLDRLSHVSAVRRVGKGLWILPRFAGEPAESRDFRGPGWYLSRFLTDHRLLEAPSYSGEIQFNPNEELPVHRWWPYVQGFSAEFVHHTCERYGIGPGKVVLDPFAGSGTVSVETRLLGAKAVASEMMPIAAFVVRAKHLWHVPPQTLRRARDEVLSSAPKLSRAPRPFLRETARQFSPGALDSLLHLKAALLKVPEGEVRTLLELAFASILVTSSRMKRSPCLGYTHKPPVPRGAPYALFSRAIDRISEDLEKLQASARGTLARPRVVQGNSKRLDLAEGSVDLAITSPPYVNGMDYVMNYKLEMAWLDQVASYEELAQLKSAMVACDNVSPRTISEHEAGRWVKEDPWLTSSLAGIRANIASKSVYRRRDMAEIVEKYFDDLVPVITRVHQALRPGGRFVVVNGDSLMAGTYLPGDLLFARLAERAGFSVEKLEVARTRRSGQRRDFRLRESVLTLRKGAAA